MKFYNAIGVFTAVLSLVLLIKHGFDMGTMAAPFELAVHYYETFTDAIFGWVAPLATRVFDAFGWHIAFYPHWKHVFLLTFLYCGASARAGGGEIGSNIFDPIWGLIVSLSVGLAAGALPLGPNAADPGLNYLIAAFPVLGSMAFGVGTSIWLRYAFRVLMKINSEVTWWEEVTSLSRREINAGLAGLVIVLGLVLASSLPVVRDIPSPGLVLTLLFAVAVALSIIWKSHSEAQWVLGRVGEDMSLTDAKAEARQRFWNDPLRRFGFNILAALGGALAFVLTNAGLQLAGI